MHSTLTPGQSIDDREPGVLLAWLREEGRSYRFQDLGESEWQALLAAADFHRVSPLLYARFRADGVLNQLPPAAKQTLERAYVVSRTRNAYRRRALEHALLALAAEGIDAILLKGAGLMITLYDEPALRPMDDLDILVAPERFRAAVACLCRCGYRPSHAEPFAGASEVMFHHLALTGTVPFKHKLELHHALLDLRAALVAEIPVPELLRRAEVLSIGAARARVLQPADQLLHLAAHLHEHVYQHGATGERLIWYYDMDQLVRREAARLSSDVVLVRAELYGVTLPLQWVLPRLVALLGTPVPSDALAGAAALAVDSAQRTHYTASTPRLRTRLGDGLQKVAGARGFRAGAGLAWRLLFPDRSYMQAQYGDVGAWRLMIRYPVRWAEVIREACTARQPFKRS